MDLTERALEDAILEIDKLLTEQRANISIRPTKLFMRPEVLRQLAEEHNMTQRKMLALIIKLCRKAARDANA